MRMSRGSKRYAADAGVTIGKIERIVVEETGDDSGFEQMLKVLGQTEVVSSEYASDEFHFQLRMPAPKIPDRDSGCRAYANLHAGLPC